MANQLVWTLLNPLGSIRHDIQHLNRRQAAAILGYLVYETSPRVQTMVNMWLKKLKENDCGKYLESMLLALKKSFEDLVLIPLQQHQLAVTRLEEYQPPSLLTSHRGRGRGDQEVDEEEALEEAVAMCKTQCSMGWTRVSQLSKRYAQTLGVGKCSGTVAGYVVQLLQVAMKFGLQSIHHLAFFQTGLESFLGHLKLAQLQQVRESLTTLITNLRRAGLKQVEAAAVYEVISRGVLHQESHEDEEVIALEEKICVDSFLAFGLKIGWELEVVPDEEEEEDEREEGEEGRGGVSSTRALESEEFMAVVNEEDEDEEERMIVSPVPPPHGSGVLPRAGRRRSVGGRQSSGVSRYTSVGDDDEEEEEEEEEEDMDMETVTVTMVAASSQCGTRPLASGLHLQGLDEGEDDEETDASATATATATTSVVLPVRKGRGGGGRGSAKGKGGMKQSQKEEKEEEEDLTQGVSTQSSEQSEDLFEEFDMRKSRQRFG